MRLLAKGDSHFGLNFSGVDLSDDAEKVYSDIVDTAIEEDVHAFVDLGDLFHSNHPRPEVYARAFRQVRRLSDAGIFTFILTGNHDVSYRPGRRESLAPLIELRLPFVHVASDVMVLGNFIEFARKEIKRLKPADGNLLERYRTKHGECCFVFLPFIPRNKVVARGEVLEDVLEQTIESASVVASRNIKVVYFFHYEFRDAIINPDSSFRATKAIIPDSIRKKKFLTLGIGGHLHHAQILQTRPHPIIYPGSAQKNSFIDANKEKGFLIIDTEKIGNRRRDE